MNELNFGESAPMVMYFSINQGVAKAEGFLGVGRSYDFTLVGVRAKFLGNYTVSTGERSGIKPLYEFVFTSNQKLILDDQGFAYITGLLLLGANENQPLSRPESLWSEVTNYKVTSGMITGTGNRFINLNLLYDWKSITVDVDGTETFLFELYTELGGLLAIVDLDTFTSLVMGVTTTTTTTIIT